MGLGILAKKWWDEVEHRKKKMSMDGWTSERNCVNIKKTPYFNIWIFSSESYGFARSSNSSVLARTHETHVCHVRTRYWSGARIPVSLFEIPLMIRARKSLNDYAAMKNRAKRHLNRIVQRSKEMDSYTSFDEILDICTDTSLKPC